MDVWEISFRSRARGRISSGEIFSDVENYEHDVASAIAERAEDVWVVNLMESIRNPTPYYWRKIHHYPISPTRYVVDDHDIVYGPWLEGVGSRNAPVTIFPGYWSMRRAKEKMQVERGRIGRRILREYRSRGLLI